MAAIPYLVDKYYDSRSRECKLGRDEILTISFPGDIGKDITFSRVGRITVEHNGYELLVKHDRNNTNGGSVTLNHPKYSSVTVHIAGGGGTVTGSLLGASIRNDSLNYGSSMSADAGAQTTLVNYSVSSCTELGEIDLVTARNSFGSSLTLEHKNTTADVIYGRLNISRTGNVSVSIPFTFYRPGKIVYEASHGPIHKLYKSDIAYIEIKNFRNEDVTVTSSNTDVEIHKVGEKGFYLVNTDHSSPDTVTDITIEKQGYGTETVQYTFTNSISNQSLDFQTTVTPNSNEIGKSFQLMISGPLDYTWIEKMFFIPSRGNTNHTIDKRYFGLNSYSINGNWENNSAGTMVIIPRVNWKRATDEYLLTPVFTYNYLSFSKLQAKNVSTYPSRIDKLCPESPFILKYKISGSIVPFLQLVSKSNANMNIVIEENPADKTQREIKVLAKDPSQSANGSFTLKTQALTGKFETLTYYVDDTQGCNVLSITDIQPPLTQQLKPYEKRVYTIPNLIASDASVNKHYLLGLDSSDVVTTLKDGSLELYTGKPLNSKITVFQTNHKALEIPYEVIDHNKPLTIDPDVSSVVLKPNQPFVVSVVESDQNIKDNWVWSVLEYEMDQTLNTAQVQHNPRGVLTLNPNGNECKGTLKLTSRYYKGEKLINVNFTNTIPIQCSVSDINTFINNKIEIVVSDPTTGITVDVQNTTGNIQVENVNANTFKIYSDVVSEGRIVLKASGYDDFEIPVNIRDILDIDLRLDPVDGKAFLGDPITVDLSSQKDLIGKYVPNIQLLGGTQASDIKITKKGLIYTVTLINYQPEYRFNIQIPGFRDKEFTLGVKAMNPDEVIVPQDLEVYVGEEIVIGLKTDHTDYNFSISNNNDNAVQIVTDPLNPKQIKLTSSAPNSNRVLSITKGGSGPKDISFVFKAKDVLTIKEGEPFNVAFNDQFVMTVEGTTNPVQVDVNSDYLDINTVDYVSTLTAKKAGNTEIQISGTGVVSKTVSVTIAKKDMVLQGNDTVEDFHDQEITVTLTEPTQNVTFDVNTVPTSAINVVDSGNGVFKLTATQACTGSVTFKADNYNNKEVQVTFKDYLQMNVDIDPVNNTAYVGEKMTFTVTPANTAITTVLDPNTPGAVQITDKGNGVFEAETTQPYQGRLTFQQQGFVDKTVDMVFEALDVITVDEGDVITKYLDETLQLHIKGTTKTFTVDSSDKSVATVSKRNKVVNVALLQDGQTDITIEGKGIQRKVVSLTVKPLMDMVITGTGTETAEINNDINVSVTTPSTPVTHQLTSTPLGAIQVVDDGANGFTLSSSQEATGVLTFQALNYKDKTVDVSFTLPGVVNDVLHVTLKPGGIIQQGKTITAKVTGTTKPFTAQSDNPDIVTNLTTQDTVEITATNSGSANITLQGQGIVTKTFQVTFLPAPVAPIPPVPPVGPQFSVANTNVQFNESDVFKDVDILNLVGTLTANSNNPLLETDVIVNPGNSTTVVRLSLDNEIQKDLQAEVTLSVPGQQDVILNVTVVNDVIKLPTMDMDGKTYEAELGQEILVQGPTPALGDNFIITTDLNVVYRVDVDRIYLKSDVKGDYTVKVELNGYQTANLTFKAKDPIVVPPHVNQPWFDLGPAPVTTVIANEDNFVDKVYENPVLDTDQKKIAYLLEYGSPDIKGSCLTLCQYQEDLKQSTTKDLLKGNYGAKQNFKLYARLISFVKISDYYSFRACMRIALKIFKIYKDDAFKITHLNRFELDWPADEVKLKEYQALVSFLVDYVNKNGVGVSPNGLPFDDEIKARFNRFLQENLRP